VKDTLLQGILAIAAGFFTLFCAGMDYEWFMSHRKARFFVNIFGRRGARIFYGLLGAIMLGLGAFLIFNNL
jgi:hypothetical protein